MGALHKSIKHLLNICCFASVTKTKKDTCVKYCIYVSLLKKWPLGGCGPLTVSGLSLVNTGHVTKVLASDWSIHIMWPEYYPLIGWRTVLTVCVWVQIPTINQSICYMMFFKYCTVILSHYTSRGKRHYWILNKLGKKFKYSPNNLIWSCRTDFRWFLVI